MDKSIDVQHTIDEGVPIPVRKVVVTVPIRDLKVGESVLFPIEQRPGVQTQASNIKRRTGHEYTVRKVSDTECRVWRTK